MQICLHWGLFLFILYFEELGDYVSEKIPIEEIFESIKDDATKGFTGEVFKLINYKKTKKNLVDKRFDEFAKTIAAEGS